MVRCSICDEHELSSCEECGDEFKEGDFIYCFTLGRHTHRDCMPLSKARIIK